MNRQTGLVERVEHYLQESEYGEAFYESIIRTHITPYVFYSYISPSEIDEALAAWKQVANDATTLNITVFELLAAGLDDDLIYELPFIFRKHKGACKDCLQYLVTGRGADLIPANIIEQLNERAKKDYLFYLEQLLN